MPRRSGGTKSPDAAVDSVRPPRSTSPRSGLSSPATSRKVVVLPQPLGPSSVRNSPAFASKLRSFTATTAPNLLTRPVARTVPMCWCVIQPPAARHGKPKNPVTSMRFPLLDWCRGLEEARLRHRAGPGARPERLRGAQPYGRAAATAAGHLQRGSRERRLSHVREGVRSAGESGRLHGRDPDRRRVRRDAQAPRLWPGHGRLRPGRHRRGRADGRVALSRESLLRAGVVVPSAEPAPPRPPRPPRPPDPGRRGRERHPAPGGAAPPRQRCHRAELDTPRSHERKRGGSAGDGPDRRGLLHHGAERDPGAAPAAQSRRQPLERPAHDRLHDRYRFLSTVTLGEGVIDLVSDVPDRDVTLLAATATLVVREDVHPVIVRLLLKTAETVHSRPGLFEAPNAFPSDAFVELPLHEVARRYLRKGPPFLERFLPFWIAVTVERWALLVLPVVGLLLPLIRILPSLYNSQMRRRVPRWYRRVQAEVSQMPPPPHGLMGELYHLKIHLEWLLARADAQAAAPAARHSPR